MSDYPAIRNILSSAFSVQTGLNDDAARAMYQRAFAANPGLRAEVQQVFVDEDVNWCELLFNREYEVYEADSEAEAKEVARGFLLKHQD